MKVKITLLEEVLGSSPSNEELLATYISSKAPTDDLTAEEIANIKAQNAEDRITVFPKTADGKPFLYDYQVKGFFKDSCKMLAKAGKSGYPGGKACAAIKAYKQARSSRQGQRRNLKFSALTRSWKIWCANALIMAPCAGWVSGETAAKAALNGRKSNDYDKNKNAAPVHHHRNGKKTEHRKKL